jgi:hypothetical protein
MSKRSIAMLAAALALFALAAGCGGGDDGDDTPAEASPDAPALTKAEFIKQGDRICATASEEYGEGIEAFIEENDWPSREEEEEEELLAEIVLPRIRVEMEELRELGPPEGEEERVDVIFTGVEEVVAEGEADPSTVTGNENPFADPNAEAKTFGFKVCGQS